MSVALVPDCCAAACKGDAEAELEVVKPPNVRASKIAAKHLSMKTLLRRQITQRVVTDGCSTVRNELRLL
jgi:hypothetical protein